MAMAIATMAADADTLKIGVFNLPYRFEDTNITDIVRYVVTNDVIAYKSATVSFTPPFVRENGVVTVKGENSYLTTLYFPPLFENGIEFRIENGQTNCVIKQSLTDAAKAVEDNLPTRVNLVAGAKLFVDSMADGSITNKTIAELRSLTRLYQNGVLSVVNTTEGPDEDIARNFAYLSGEVSLFPLCILDSEYKPSGTNNCFFVHARYDRSNGYSPSRTMFAISLVYADGYWSICLE